MTNNCNARLILFIIVDVQILDLTPKKNYLFRMITSEWNSSNHHN